MNEEYEVEKVRIGRRLKEKPETEENGYAPMITSMNGHMKVSHSNTVWLGYIIIIMGSH